MFRIEVAHQSSSRLGDQATGQSGLSVSNLTRYVINQLLIHGNDTSLSQGCKNKYEYKDSKFTVLSLIKMVKQKFDLPDLGKVDSCLFLGFAGGKGAW